MRCEIHHPPSQPMKTDVIEVLHGVDQRWRVAAINSRGTQGRIKKPMTAYALDELGRRRAATNPPDGDQSKSGQAGADRASLPLWQMK